MKYVIIIPDGAADYPLEDLGGKTPFEAANKPHTDRISIEGRQGTVLTTPPGFACGSDVCTMCLLGYDPAVYHTGRAPLEAAALGIRLVETDWVFRVNLVTVTDGHMVDHSAGQVASREGRTLLDDFARRLDIPGVTLCPGVSYRNIMVDRSNRHDWSKLKTTPPHDIPNQPVCEHYPAGVADADLLCQIIDRSGEFFAGHAVNQTRRDLGELPATHLWPWGQGRRPAMDPFKQRFGLDGAMITAVDLLAGLAQLIGWDRLDAPGQTSYHDTDYASAGRCAIEALDDYDLVCVHVEAPDEAAHAADAGTKVAAIEAIDEHIVGPLHVALDACGDEYRMLYLPDHYTAVATRKHDPTPVPFAMCGKRVTALLRGPFSEKGSNESDLHIRFGKELMEFFLFSGLS